MQWIIYIGIILFYLYGAYQKEQEKLKKDASKSIKPNQSTSHLPELQDNKEKTFKEVLAEIEAAMQGKSVETTLKKQEVTTVQKNITPTTKKLVIYQPKLDEESIENEEILLESVEDDDYVAKKSGYVNQYVDNYKDNYTDNYINLQDKIDTIEAEDTSNKHRIKQVNIEDYNPLATKKMEKFIRINNKKLSAKDLFLAQMILEKKV